MRRTNGPRPGVLDVASRRMGFRFTCLTKPVRRHDSFFCENPKYKTAAWRPFPTKRLPPHHFPGNKYIEANEFVGMRIDQECPAACRGKQEWAQC
jgi:hypothetical protein